MKFSWANHTVTNTWKVNPSCWTCVCAAARLSEACHAAACLLIHSSHPQPFIPWASANIDALHVIRPTENTEAPVDAALHPPQRCERPLRGSRITRQLLFVHRPPTKMHLSAPTPLILLTYEWPQRIPVQICWVCGRVKMWNEEKKKPKPLLFVINKHTQRSCVSIQLWDVSRC